MPSAFAPGQSAAAVALLMTAAGCRESSSASMARPACSLMPIVRVKIWNPTGWLLYSDEQELVGQQFDIDHDLAEALEGELAVEVSSLDNAENVTERTEFSP